MWVNGADDPANCSFTMMSVVRRADVVVAFGTGGRSPALSAHLRRLLTEELGPEYEVLLELLSEAREGLRASGRSSERRRLATGLRLRHRGPRPRRACGGREGAPELVSLIVVGLNHRTAPVDLLERMTVPDEQLAKVLHDLAAREHLLEVVVLSTCNRTEVYARCTHFHPAVGDVSAFLSGLLGRGAGGVRRPAVHVLRRSRDRAPVLGRGRARLDDRRRGRDPRPGPRGVADRSARRHRAPARAASSGMRSSRASGYAPRPASPGTRSRSPRPPSRSPPSTSARSTARRCSSSAPVTWAPGWRRFCGRVASSTSGSPTAPARTPRTPPRAAVPK